MITSSNGHYDVMIQSHRAPLIITRFGPFLRQPYLLSKLGPWNQPKRKRSQGPTSNSHLMMGSFRLKQWAWTCLGCDLTQHWKPSLRQGTSLLMGISMILLLGECRYYCHILQMPIEILGLLAYHLPLDKWPFSDAFSCRRFIWTWTEFGAIKVIFHFH